MKWYLGFLLAVYGLKKWFVNKYEGFVSARLEVIYEDIFLFLKS